MTATEQLDVFLAAQGMPRTVAAIHREHIEAYIDDLLGRLRPASAANRYRSLQQFFRWLVDEGEIGESPMARMRPPTIPETPPPVLTDDQLTRLLKACAGTGFEDRRDTAILRLLIDGGMRPAEIAGLRLEDVDWEVDVARVVGKGRHPRAVPFGRKTGNVLATYVHRARPKHSRSDEPWLCSV
jgi:site-specific recombinase XerD